MTSTPGVFEVKFPNLGISLRDGTGGQVSEWSIDSDFLTPTDAWSISLVDDRPTPRWYELQAVELYVEGKLQLIGRVDATERGDSGSVITLRGRDYLADLTECNVDPSLTFKAGDTLNSAILLAAAPVGITTIVDPYDRNQTRIGTGGPKGPAIPKKTLTDVKPSAGMSIFECVNRLAARFGYTVQPGNARTDIVLQRPTYGGPSVGKLIRKRDNPAANNIARGIATRNWGAVPTHFVGFCQQGSSVESRTKNRKEWDMNAVVTGFGSEELKTIVWNGTIAGLRTPKDTLGQGNSGQLYRLRHFRDQNSKNAEQLSGAAARMIAAALKETLRYSVTLRGTSDPITKNVYSYDCEVDVDDDIARVNERLWIAARSFRGSRSAVHTELECWRPRTYQIDPEASG